MLVPSRLIGLGRENRQRDDRILSQLRSSVTDRWVTTTQLLRIDSGVTESIISPL